MGKPKDLSPLTESQAQKIMTQAAELAERIAQGCDAEEIYSRCSLISATRKQHTHPCATCGTELTSRQQLFPCPYCAYNNFREYYRRMKALKAKRKEAELNATPV